MTQFSSRPPFNDDPKPYRDIETGKRYKGAPAGTDYHYRYDPRPEFDRPQYNPTNRILTEFRGALKQYKDKSLCLKRYIWYTTYGDAYGWSHAERFHAQKVLTRLAELAERTKSV